MKVISWYRKERIEKDLKQKCEQVLELLEMDVFVNNPNHEVKVFFLKMKADYLRYLCEFTNSDE